MSQTTTYSTATTITTVVPVSARYVEAADLGDVGTGGALLDDDAGSTTIVGLKAWKVTQSSAPAGNQRIFSGFVGLRDADRGDGKYSVGAGRVIDLTFHDGNRLLGDYVITGSDGKRGAETIKARMTWLLGSSYTPVADHGYVVYPAKAMDKADYRGMFVGDVIRDCADAIGFNYFVYWDETNAAWSLWFDNPNTSSAYTTTAKISNAAGDADGTTVFAPDMDAKLTRDPQYLASGDYQTYSAGAVYRTNATTLSTYGHRDIVNSNFLDKTSDAAKRRGDQYLRDHDGEDDGITCAIYTLPANVNDIRAGHLMQAKFTHFNPEGYASYSYFRVKRRTVTQPDNTDERYRIDLELTPVIPFICANLSDVNQTHGTVTGEVAVESGATIWAHATISGWFGGPVDTACSTVPVYNPTNANDGNDSTFSECKQQTFRYSGSVGLYWISTLDASYIICSTSGTVAVGSAHWRSYQPTSVDYWDGSAWVTGTGHWSMTGNSTTLRWVFTFSSSPTTTKLRLRYIFTGTAGIASLWGWNALGTRVYDWTIIGAAA